MFRTMIMFTSAIAFALPMALSQPATARPLATPAQPAEWCWGDCEDDGGGGGSSVDIDLDLWLCIGVLFKDRAEFDTCEVLSGRQCLARCTPAAVATACELDLAAGLSPRSLAACQDEQLDLCREQCFSGGAGFCERRGGGDGDYDHDEDYDHDHDGYGGEDCPDDGYDPERPWEPERPSERPWEPERPSDRPWEPERPSDRPWDPERPYPDHRPDPRPSNPGWVFVDIDICIDLDVDVEVKPG